MALTVLSTLLLVFVSAAQAASKKPAPDPSVLCERSLTRVQITQKEGELVREFFGRPFTIYSVHPMKEAGMRKFGFQVDVNANDLKNLILLATPSTDGSALELNLGLFRGRKFVNLYEHKFADPALVAWDSNNQNWKVELIGYRSPPDEEGVRHFVSFTEGRHEVSGILTFGIDVPCDKAREYTDVVGMVTDELRDPSGNYCRISVLTFARTD